MTTTSNLGSLTINCDDCKLNQQSTKLTITNNLIASGTSLNSTFSDVKVGGVFNYTTQVGYLQLTNIEGAGTANYITVSRRGEVIIQSTTDMSIGGTIDTQAFCLSSAGTSLSSNSGCAVSGDSSTNNNVNGTNCTFVSNLCASGATCSPSVRYNVAVTQGNIYANIHSAATTVANS